MSKPRESKIEAHLVEQVEAAGGITRKCHWLCRRGAPDRFVAIAGGWQGFIELKASGCKPDAHQAREIEKLRRQGVNVLVIDSIEAVDAFFAKLRRQK